MKRLFFVGALLAATLSLSAQQKMQIWEGNLYSEYTTSSVDSVTFLASPAGTPKPAAVVHDTIVKEVHDTIYIRLCPDYEALKGVFSVSASKQVRFAAGNLQCTILGNDTIWMFAENQYDMLGTANAAGSVLAGKIDLFGWSGSTGAAKWGMSASTTDNDYAGDFVDWGKNIEDGTTYRTLTADEWNYLFSTRTNASDKSGAARIKLNDSVYVNGCILLPDTWTCPDGVTFVSGFESEWSADAYATHQTLTLADWRKLEAAGAVFLPAAGYRMMANMIQNVQRDGEYWSATLFDATRASFQQFRSSGPAAAKGPRYYGRAVRLVQDAE